MASTRYWHKALLPGTAGRNNHAGGGVDPAGTGCLPGSAGYLVAAVFFGALAARARAANSRPDLRRNRGWTGIVRGDGHQPHPAATVRKTRQAAAGHGGQLPPA